MNRIVEREGFTIVELLIVIVVIAILAAISIVAYNGIQQRARDNIRKSDIAAIGKSLQLYAVDNGGLMTTGSGCGGSGNGGGWFNYQGTSYTTSINNCLINAKYMSQEVVDPSGLKACGGLNCRAYFVSTCTQNSQLVTYIYANLEGTGHTINDTAGTCSDGLDESIGANYFIKIS